MKGKQQEIAIIKKRELPINQKQKKVIEDCITRFVNWLKKLELKQFHFRSGYIFEKFSVDDTMKVDHEKRLHFNLEYLKTVSVEYFVTIVLHEAYHFYINNIPNKRDAIRVKDFYYNQMMLHIDIEADFYVAKFFKEVFQFKLRNYLSLYYTGANAFKDNEIRPMKFERFICSMLTIAHLFEHDELAIYRITPDAIRMCTSKPRAILHKGKYSETRFINISTDDLDDLQRIYQHPEKFKEKGFVKKLDTILFKAVDGYKSEDIIPRMIFRKK